MDHSVVYDEQVFDDKKFMNALVRRRNIKFVIQVNMEKKNSLK